jgi:Protein of unknown function (DUF3618)
MSTEGEVTPGDAPTGDVQALTDEIERTRMQLGETVEALAAKADVKARAQQKAADAKARAQEKAADAKQTILEVGGQVKDQVTSGTAQAAATVWNRTPEPVQRAAKRAADSARQRRAPLAMAVGAALLVGWLIARRRRR